MAEVGPGSRIVMCLRGSKYEVTKVHFGAYPRGQKRLNFLGTGIVAGSLMQIGEDVKARVYKEQRIRRFFACYHALQYFEFRTGVIIKAPKLQVDSYQEGARSQTTRTP